MTDGKKEYSFVIGVSGTVSLTIRLVGLLAEK